MKNYKDFIIEAKKDKIIFVEGKYLELWVTYAQSSGQTAQFSNKTYITDKKGDKNYDSLVTKISKFAKANKPMKSSKTSKLFEIPVYPTVSNGRYDIWGGDIKPIGKKYIIVDDNKVIVTVNLFNNKKESINWINSLKEDVELDEAKEKYQIYHKLFSDAITEVLKFVSKRGFEMDEDEYWNQVSTGPKKPSEGKTNRYNIPLTKNGKKTRQKIAFQILGIRNKYELNMYID